MRRHTSIPRSAMVIIALILSIVSPVVMAQPAPNPCPEGQVYLPDQKVCVPADQVPPVVATEAPVEPPVQPPAGDLASFTLYHLACDNDFQADAVRDAGGVGPANGCFTFGKPPFTYTIAANEIPITTTTLDATERDYARLDVPSPVPAGALTITVTPVDGYTTELVSCALSIGDGFGEIVEPSIVGGSATLTTQPDQDVECWVYNVTRGAEADPGVVADPPEGTGTSITIAAYNCPAGTAAAGDLIALCTERASGLAFSLVTATDTVATMTSDAEGDIHFPNVAPNDYGIAASLPAGYGTPIVMCYHAFVSGVVEEGAQDIVFGNQFRFTIFDDGESLECAWYNVPALGADNGPNIFIEARTCRSGTAVSTSMTVFDAQALCPNFYIDLEFQVLNVDQVIATERTNADFLSAGQVFFTKLPEPQSGGYGVTASLHEGERTLAVFCDQDFGDGTFQIVPVRVSGDRLDQELGMGAGNTMRCTWFIEMNPLMSGTHAPDAPLQEAAPAETGDETTLVPGITVLARLCPPEVVEQRVDLAVACFVPAVGVTFDVLVGGEPSTTQVTGETGEVDVPVAEEAATYRIVNLPNTGLSEPDVSCTITRADGTVEQVGSAGSDGSPGQEILFDGASEVICTFYFLGSVEPSDPAQDDVADDPAVPDDEALPGNQAGEEEQAPSEVAAEDADAGSDVPDATGLSVLALRCPPEATGPDVVLNELCTEPATGLTFEILVDDQSIGTAVTDADGNLAIPADAGAGMYHFRHEPAPDLLEMRTECASVYPNGATASGSSSAVGAQMSDLYLSYDDASRVTCTFYFVAESTTPQTGDAPQAVADEAAGEDGNTTGTHSFTLQFWACADGIDPASDRDSLAQACEVETGERSFMLTIDGASTGETSTGASTWEFQEGPVSADLGIGPVSSVWCDSSWTGGGEDAAETQDEVSLEGNALTVTVSHPATTVSCDWFIFPS